MAAWNVADSTYNSENFVTTTQDNSPTGVYFRTNGLRMFVVGSGGDAVYQYTLSTAWDVSTASYDSVSFSVSSQTTVPLNIVFRPDGTQMYVNGLDDVVYEYDLSTAWDLSTASYSNNSFNMGTQDSQPFAVCFKDDGTKMYMAGDSGNSVYQYSLSTAWDVSTLSYDSVSFSVSGQETTIRALACGDSGTKFYVGGESSDTVHEYEMGTAWDLTTAANVNLSFDISSETTTIIAIQFQTDGSKMFTVGNTDDTVFAYDIDTTSFPGVESITTTSNSSGSGTQNISMPQGVDSGDLLLMIIMNNNAFDEANPPNTPSGWTSLWKQQVTTGTFSSAFVKVSDGTEGGTTVGVTVPDDGYRVAAQVYRIVDWLETLSGVEDGTIATGTSTSPNPPSLTPSWGSENTLWIATSINNDDSGSVTGYPTNYLNGISTETGASSSTGGTVASAYRRNATSSEDPGTFTLSSSEPWNANTIAIRSPAAVGVVLQINIGDDWKDYSGLQINIGDSWKTVSGLQINIGDTWRTIF